MEVPNAHTVFFLRFFLVLPFPLHLLCTSIQEPLQQNNVDIIVLRKTYNLIFSLIKLLG